MSDPDSERRSRLEALQRLRWNWKGTSWRAGAVLAVIAAAYVHHYLNIDNPALERKLVGCWGIAGRAGAFTGAEVLDVSANGTFTESRAGEFVKQSIYTTSSGVWQVQKDEWTLYYKESTSNLFPKGGKLVVKVLEASEGTIQVQDPHKTIGVYYRLPTRGGVCRPMI